MLSQEKLNNIFLKIIHIGIYLSLLTPLFFSSKFIYPFIFPKTILFQIIMEMVFFFYILLCLSDKNYLPKLSIINVSVTIFFGVLIITSIFGFDQYQSFFGSLERSDGIFTLLHLYLFFIITSAIMKNQRQYFTLFGIFSVVIFLETIVSLAQFYGVSIIYAQGEKRPIGSLGNPAYLASLLSSSIFLIFFSLYKFKNGAPWTDVRGISQRPDGANIPYHPATRDWYWDKFWKIFLGATLLLSIWTLVLTENRGGIFALLFGLIILILLQIIPKTHSFRKFTSLFLFFIIVGALALIYLFKNVPLIWHSPLQRLTTTSLESVTIENRLINWKAGWQGFLERPLLGWGWQNFYIVFNKYFDPRIIKDQGTFSWYDKSHNTFMDILVASGVFGLLSYFAIFVAVYIVIWKRQKNSEKQKFSLSVLSTFFATYLFQTFFLFDTINTYILLFLMLAYLCFRGAKNHMRSRNIKKLETPYIVTLGTVVLLFLITFNIIPLFASYHASKVFVEKNRTYQNVQSDYEKVFRMTTAKNIIYREGLANYVNSKLKEPQKDENLLKLSQFAFFHLQASVNARPYRVTSRLILSENSRLRGDFEEAEKNANEILALSPKRYHGYFAVGKIKISQRKYAESMDYFKKALSLYPNFIGAHWNLAVAYILQDDWENAANEITIMEGIDKDYLFKKENISKLGQAYLERKNIDGAIILYQKARDTYPQNQYYLDIINGLYDLKNKVESANQ